MVDDQRGAVLRGLRTLFGAGSVAGLSDGQLLERFVTRGGEAAELAFAALVERHGPMVLRVCRRVLADAHDVEDAFQATFLILVKKAGSIRRRDSVGSWLHGVAVRVASYARGAEARRRVHERNGAAMAATWMVEERDDLGPVLHEEVARLPEKYRAPVVLCYLEGRTYDEVAEQLCWPVGTVKSRLARGRDRLQARLIRRGLAPSALVLGVELSAGLDAASIPAALLESTVRAATRFAAGPSAANGALSATVVTLTQGVLKAMFLTKCKLAAVALLSAAGIVSTGAAVQAQFSGPEFDRRAAFSQQQRLENVERKLDRILQALEGPPRPEERPAPELPPPENVPRPSAPGGTSDGPAMPKDAPRPPFALPGKPDAPRVEEVPGPPPYPPMRLPSAREQSLERRVNDLERRLEILEAKFREGSRVGRGEQTPKLPPEVDPPFPKAPGEPRVPPPPVAPGEPPAAK